MTATAPSHLFSCTGLCTCPYTRLYTCLDTYLCTCLFPCLDTYLHVFGIYRSVPVSIHTPTCLSKHMLGLYAWSYMCLCICINIDMCVDMCVSTCVDTYVSTCLDMYVSTCLDMCVSVCVDMCVSVCVDMCLSVCLDMCVCVCVAGSVKGEFETSFIHWRCIKGDIDADPPGTGRNSCGSISLWPCTLMALYNDGHI